MKNREYIFVAVRRIVLLGFLIFCHISFIVFLLLLVAEYIIDTIFLLLKMPSAKLANTEIEEGKISHYRSRLISDYLYFNIYLLMIVAIPTVFIFIFFVSFKEILRLGGQIFYADSFLFVGLLVVMLFIHSIELILHFTGKNKIKPFLEELTGFNHIRMYLFCVLLLFSGLISWILSENNPLAETILIVLILSGDTLLQTRFNRQKETMTF